MAAQSDAASTFYVWLGGGGTPGDLESTGARVEIASPTSTAKEIAALAPDLVIAGPSARARASDLAVELRSARPAAPLAIVTLGDEGGALEQRFGVVGQLALEPAATLASRLGAVVDELEAGAPWAVKIAPKELAGLVARALRGGRAGLLTASDPPIAVALGSGGAIAPPLDALRDRLAKGEAIAFHERPEGRVAVLSEELAPGPAPSLEGARIALIGSEAEQKAWTDALAPSGADVHGFEPEGVEGARALDPTLVIVAAPALAGSVGVALTSDVRLAAASLLVLDAPPDAQLNAQPSAGSIARAAAELCREELHLREQVAAGQPVLDRIETLGAARWLKTAARAPGPVALQLRSRGGIAEIQLASGKVKEAWHQPAGGERVAGRPAIAALLGMRLGTVLLASTEQIERLLAERKPRPPAPSESKIAERGPAESKIAESAHAVDGPAEAAKPVESAEPAAKPPPRDAAKPAIPKAAKPAKPPEPAKPVEAGKPVEAAKPVEAGKPAEAAKPTEAGKPALKPGEIKSPPKPGQPADALKKTGASVPKPGVSVKKPMAVAVPGPKAGAKGARADMPKVVAPRKEEPPAEPAPQPAPAPIPEPAPAPPHAETALAPVAEHAPAEPAAPPEPARVAEPATPPAPVAQPLPAEPSAPPADTDLITSWPAPPRTSDLPVELASEPPEPAPRTSDLPVELVSEPPPEPPPPPPPPPREEAPATVPSAEPPEPPRTKAAPPPPPAKKKKRKSDRPPPASSDADRERQRKAEEIVARVTAALPTKAESVHEQKTLVMGGSKTSLRPAPPPSAERLSVPPPRTSSRSLLWILLLLLAAGAVYGIHRWVRSANGPPPRRVEPTTRFGTDAGPPPIDAGHDAGPPVVVAPPSVDQLFEELETAKTARNFERVEELARQILQIDAESALAAYELGLVLLRRGRGAEALEWAERGATLDPRDPRHLLLQGDIHRRGSRLGVAREKWQACLLLNPRYTPCQRRLDETAGL